MAVNDYLGRHDTLEPIVVPLYDNLLGLPIVLGLSGRSFAVGENVVVVAVYHDFSRFGVFLEDHLVIVTIDRDACYVVLRFNVECHVMVVDDEGLRLMTWLRLGLALSTTSVPALSVLLMAMRVPLVLGRSPIPPVASLITLAGLLLGICSLAELGGHVQTLICKLTDIHKVLHIGHPLHILVNQVLLGHVLALTLMV